MSYMGLDIGTSGCKAAVFEEDGTLLAKAYQSYSVVHSNSNWAELDSAEVMEKCFAVVRTAAKESGGNIKALGISSQGEAFTPVGRNGEFLGNAMVSSDSRAKDFVSQWEDEFGGGKLYKITGHTPSSMFTLFKLAWLKKNCPDIWTNARAFYCFEDLFHFKLGVSPAMGWPLAGRTMLFDINTHQWSNEIFKALELDKDKLATPLPSGSLVGIIPDITADELGLPSGVKVVTGGHDQTICALGCGAFESGSAMYATGTVECICPVVSEKILCENLCSSNLCSYDYSIPGKYTTVAYSLTGGNILQWFKEEFGQAEVLRSGKENKSAYDLLLDEMPDEPSGLLALPYFTPSGTPFFDAGTKGTILGLRLSSSRHEILKALLESVVLEMKLNLNLMEESGINIKRLIASGGGASSLKWLQLKADVLNKPIIKTDIEETGCFGAALLACANDTGKSLENLFSKQENSFDEIIPSPEKSMIYKRKYDDYIKIYPVLKDLYRNLSVS
jgi:xylulokinase